MALAVAGALAGVGLHGLLFGGGATTPRAPRAAPPCHDGPVTPGIDVSYHQGAIEWRRVREAGVRFAFVRVSDGSTFADPMFARHWADARRARVLRGAYQYFRPDESALAQADLMIAALRRDAGELPPVIDVETTGGRSPAQIERAVAAWIARVREQLGVEPILYTGPDFWTTQVRNADLTPRPPLWLAHYTAGCPTVPAPWKAWTFWQYTDRGEVPGITGPVDLDVFAGSVEQLAGLARRAR